MVVLPLPAAAAGRAAVAAAILTSETRSYLTLLTFGFAAAAAIITSQTCFSLPIRILDAAA